MAADPRTLFTRDSRFAVTAADGSNPARLVGYAMIWNAVSSDRGGYRVQLMPNSARFATPTLALYGHDFAAVLGSTDNGSLRIAPDETGVRVEIDLPDTSVGRDVAALVKRRDIGGMSFSMVNGPEKHRTITEGGRQIVVVEEFTVDEVTVTAIPAFRETSVAHAGYHDATVERHRFQSRRLLSA